MRSQHKRLFALEAYVESCVEEEVRRELEAAFELLEARLTHEEFVRVARILADMGGGECWSRTLQRPTSYPRKLVGTAQPGAKEVGQRITAEDQERARVVGRGLPIKDDVAQGGRSGRGLAPRSTT